MGWKTFVLSLGLLLGMAVQAREISFELQSPDGVVTEKTYAGKYVLMAFGYTSCPDICPTTLYDMAKTLDALPNAAAVQPVFISIDPVSDDLERLNAYTRHFDPRIIGLTGDIAHLRALTDSVGASFGYRLNGKTIDVPQAGTGYSVSHSTLIYLISPQGKLLDRYDYRIGSQGLGKALQEVLPQTAAAPDCPLPTGFSAASRELALAELVPDSDARVALLNLWALWCKPCREELPLLDTMAQNDENLAVHVLNLGDDPGAIDALFQELDIKHLSRASSDDGDILERFGAVGLPYTALFVDGKLFAAKSGVLDESATISAFAHCLYQP